MRKYSKVLFEKMISGATHFKCGNHRFEKIDNVNYFTYHKTDIVIINEKNKIITIDNGGWDTSSTNQAIRSHIEAISQYLDLSGYTFIDSSEGKIYTAYAESVLGIYS